MTQTEILTALAGVALACLAGGVCAYIARHTAHMALMRAKQEIDTLVGQYETLKARYDKACKELADRKERDAKDGGKTTGVPGTAAEPAPKRKKVRRTAGKKNGGK